MKRLLLTVHQTLRVFEQSFHFLKNQIFHQIWMEYCLAMFPIRNNTTGRFHLKYQKQFCIRDSKNWYLDT